MPGGSQRQAGGRAERWLRQDAGKAAGRRGWFCRAPFCRRGKQPATLEEHTTARAPRTGLEEVAQPQPEGRGWRGEVSPRPALFEAGGVRKPLLPGVRRTGHANPAVSPGHRPPVCPAQGRELP